MEQRVIRKTNAIKKQLSELEYVIFSFKKQLIEDDCSPEEQEATFHEITIYRLKHCIDTFWRYLETYLRDEGFPLEILSPKSMIRTSVRSRLINEEEASSLMATIEIRNKIADEENEENPRKITECAPEIFNAMNIIVERLTKRLEDNELGA